MIKKEYKLSDSPDSSDVISQNISKRREKIYYNIKNFSVQKKNDGIYAENILRLVLDGVNLNHLSKNHPHVDIAIINPIEGFSQKGEIISVKSSIRKPKLSNLISDTKSIKLESMFSYIIFSNSNYELDFKASFFSPKTMLNKSIELMRNSESRNYKEVVNLVAYYIMFKNDAKEEMNFRSDLAKIINNDFINLAHGTYKTYRISVLRRLVYLDNPISLGTMYLERIKELTCVIKKTNPIKLNKYWEKLVDIWLDEEFFESKSVKYLNISQVKDLFKIPGNEDFPIEIKISLGDYSPDNTDFSKLSDAEKIKISKAISDKRTNKLYVATKFKDAEFGEEEKDVNDFFLKSINILEDKPKLITKFNNFISSIQNPPKLTKWW